MNLQYETSLDAHKIGLPKYVISVFEACLVLWKKVILYLQTPLKIILLDAKHYPICKYFNWINGSLTQRIYNHNSIITQLIWSILSGNVSKGFTNSGELYWAVPLLKCCSLVAHECVAFSHCISITIAVECFSIPVPIPSLYYTWFDMFHQ